MKKRTYGCLPSIVNCLFLSLFLLSSCTRGAEYINTLSESSSSFHVHTYSQGWASNEAIHWHPDLCGHGTRINEEEHLYGEWIHDFDGTNNCLKRYHRICSVCGYIDDLLPYYYSKDNYLAKKIDLINDYCSYPNTMAFSFITDLHLLHNSFSSKELMRIVLDNTPTSFVVCGGDIVSAYCDDDEAPEESCNSQLQTWNSWLDYWKPSKVFQIRGNHDFIVNNRLHETYYKMSEKDTVFAALSRNMDAVDYEEDLGICYYYDCPNNKLRFIFLDDYIVSARQDNILMSAFSSKRMDWLINVLDCSSDNHLIVVTHETCDDAMNGYSPSMEPLHRILSSFKNKTLFKGEYNGFSWYHDFGSAEGELVCILNGHSHKDESHVKDGVLSISTTCDTPYNDDLFDRIRGSVSESAFDVFNVDLNNKIIRSTRIGAGVDRFWEY